MDSADGVMCQYLAGHAITTSGAPDQEWILTADQTSVSQSYPAPGSCSCRQPMVLFVALTDKRGRRLALFQNLRRPKYGSLRDRHCQGGVTLPRGLVLILSMPMLWRASGIMGAL